MCINGGGGAWLAQKYLCCGDSGGKGGNGNSGSSKVGWVILVIGTVGVIVKRVVHGGGDEPA